ncbi:TetR/AcrR family transcriptional regulator [Streptomyces sp. NPDC017941]|uniref:TetR/AcrR family transcriptional regulator n=1 Tax=unclassified Streptomyces TaxID=2593676 RepID=UPI0037972189
MGADNTAASKVRKRTDGRIARGNQTRQVILRHAVDVASVRGLEGLSLGQLADELELSKSGVFSLFGSKEELQRATVRAAIAIFLSRVVIPSRRGPDGVAKIRHLCERWLEYSRTRVFPGGCFFYSVSVELDARPGPVRDEVAAARANWRGFIEQLIEDAREAGQIRPETDRRQLAFELTAFMETANGESLLSGDDSAYGHASNAILNRLRSAATDPELLPDVP